MSADVLIFKDPGFEQEYARVVAACSRVGLSYGIWSETQEDSGARFVVGFLPNGERRVPRQILKVLSAKDSRTPLLLIAREKLAQPSTWLEAGLLVVLGDSPSELHIASRLRMLDASASAHEQTGSSLREVRRARYFAATYSNVADRVPSPRMVERAEEWIALLPLDDGPLLAADDLGAGPPEGADENCGVVRLGTRNGLLMSAVPARWGSLTLASPRRAPAVFRFTGASSMDQATVRTASADLFVALSASAERITEHAGWRQALRAGAGAVLAYFEEQARDGVSVQGVVVEVL